jgi:hypothetical protein
VSRHPFAFWLIPAAPAYETFAEIIWNLVRQYEAVPFEPHVTFFVGENHPQEILLQLGTELAQTHPPLTLTGQKVDFSTRFFKTVFVAFFDDPILTSLYRQTAVTLDDHNFKLVFPNPETGNFADIGGWHVVQSWKLGEGGDHLT